MLVPSDSAKPPYGKCIDTEDDSTNYYQNYTYTLETCFNGCKQRNTVKECGCANPRIMKADADVLCTPTESNLACLQHLKGDQTNQTDPNIDILTDCGCNPPCDENSFKPTASLSRFPADNYYVATDSVNGVAGSCDVSNTKFPSRTDCQKWYSTNGLIIQVFFETLSYELYTESASYGVSDIINDLGGQAGLWLGLSVISVVEVEFHAVFKMVGLILLLFAFCVSGDAIKIRPDENDLNNDQRIKDVDDVRKEIDHIDKRHEESNNFEDLNEKKGN
ncbi:unnamed protein product [Caenorhabditis auriculariae]|uniref:Uncharacterized protein n=1 Tax=Caenorhabditis auriculariae TaxID=2777116 RepID=A0A8S1GRD4_9PELO|nr:unnamed protein product [Caenorhabditis auriculariae]